MNRLDLRWMVLGLAALTLLSGGARAAEPVPPIPVADFFRKPVVTAPVMSPSGRHVAATMAGGSDKRLRLVILNLQDLAQSKVIAAFDNADIQSVAWVNDERLVFSLTDRNAEAANQIGSGLFAVDRDGKSGTKLLIGGYGIGIDGLSAAHRFRSVLRDGSSDVIVERFMGSLELNSTQIWRLDTVTGRARILTKDPPDHALGWALDFRGTPRVAVSVGGGKTRLYWKANDAASWLQVRETQTYGGGSGAMNAIWVGADGMLYLAGHADRKSDKTVLYRLDMNKSQGEPDIILSLDGYDFSGSLVTSPDGRLLGVRYLSDARATHWFDPAIRKLQAEVDALLPGTNNRIDCGGCQNLESVLVGSSSDRQPPIYWLYEQGKLVALTASRPWIDAKSMARRDMQRISARDGLSIPVHVTRPVGATGPTPMVVLVHGGPYVRGGEWSWNPDSQFLASRGYVVIEPEFRGSTGFGSKLFVAGWKQWGLAMQDDIADATRWAVKQGYADPNKICIAGASYGGYATLMGLVRYPELYRCGVEWAGVTDIDLMYSIVWSDLGGMWREYGMPVLIGDREKDAAQLTETSPLKQAARITQPLLMAHGAVDRRVPIKHGYLMRDALAFNPNAKWIEYRNEGHGWSLEANNVDFWTQVEGFLKQSMTGERRTAPSGR